MKLVRSIRFKLTVWYAIVMGMVLVFFSIALYVIMERTLYAEVDAKIKAMAEVTASSSNMPAGHFDLLQLDAMFEEKLGFRTPGRFIQILDNTGSVGQTSANLRAHPLPISLKALRKASDGEVSFETVATKTSKYPIRVITFPVIENNQIANIIQIGTSLESVEETLNNLYLTILFGVPASMILASFGGWFMAKKSLLPVNNITTAARKITAENLERKIEVSNPDDEVGRLAETFNEMILRLNNSFKQISQFSSDVSHELRTPLTILRGEMEVALRTERSRDEYKDVLASGLEEVERMSLMVEQLLQLTKAEQGVFNLDIKEVALHKLLDQTLNKAWILAREKGLRVSIEERQELYVKGDEIRLRQLLLNLIDNAIKYTNEGTVELRLSRNGDHALISVKDTGLGIPDGDKERIFERFYRVDKSRSREIGGTGLGLAICKLIAEAHGGSISVESMSGRGSTFSIMIPLIRKMQREVS